jgi:hypothetical protein
MGRSKTKAMTMARGNPSSPLGAALDLLTNGEDA